MDVDVVPGSVTHWTVTIDDQRRLKSVMVRLRLRSWAYWALGVVLPVLVTSIFWFSMHDPGLGPVGRAVQLGITVTIGTIFLALMLTLPLLTLPRRVERDYPVGATMTAWATEAGLGVRTLNRLTFYPWSRMTHVEMGSVLVRCRQQGPKTVAAPAYLPAGPDELARSLDFPAQLIGPEIRRELAKGMSREPAATPTAGKPVVVDRALRWRLVRAWVRAQLGIVVWLFPAVFGFSVAIQLVSGSYGLAIFLAVPALLNPLVWLLTGEGRISGIYRAGATVTGSVGEWLEIQGPWGSVAWPHGWLKQHRMTAHTVTYEMVQVHPDGTPADAASGDKRIIVIPRAFLDTPRPAVSPQV